MDLPKKVPKSSKEVNLESKTSEKQEIKDDGNIKEEVNVKNDCYIKSEKNNEEVQNLVSL